MSRKTAPPSVSSNASAWQIISFTSLSFVVYLAIGLPLAILPEYVHMRMGYHASLAGLVISIQYIATFLSRPWAGRISDRKGAKISVLWGMGACTLSGFLMLGAAALHRNPAWLSLTSLIASRLVLGVGESLGSTGATLWGISSAGPEHTAKVISYNGVSTYGALALGAPLGVVMETHWGLSSVAILTIVVCALAYALGSTQAAGSRHSRRTSSVPKRSRSRYARTAWASRSAESATAHSPPSSRCSTSAAIGTAQPSASPHSELHSSSRDFFSFAPSAPLVASRSPRFASSSNLSACCCCGDLPRPWMALCGAALTGFGYSLVFPALGVEAVERVPVENRGTALGVYTVFADVSFFMVGPSPAPSSEPSATPAYFSSRSLCVSGSSCASSSFSQEKNRTHPSLPSTKSHPSSQG